MAENYLAKACINTVREALVFWSPQNASLDGLTPRTTPKLNGTVQIIDVFSLEVATSFSRVPDGRLKLESKPSIAAGRSWSLAKATQLIRNDVHPHRWVALHKNNRAWGMFWAGGGLQLCREHLASKIKESDKSSALVPINAERILALVLNTDENHPNNKPSIPASTSLFSRDLQLVGITSGVWMIILMLVVAGFHHAFEQQNLKLDTLLERVTPAQTKQSDDSNKVEASNLPKQNSHPDLP